MGRAHVGWAGGRLLATALAAAALTAAALPAGADGELEPTAQPGDTVTIDGATCTLGFLLRGSDGASYMTTAGHCVFPDGGTRAWERSALGPVVQTLDGRIGSVVFAENVPSADGDDEYDFAVLRLDADIDARPEISGVGMPSGLNEEQRPLPARLRTPGPRTKAGADAPERELVARSMERPEFVYAYAVVDAAAAGSPVVDGRGRAVGMLLGSDDGTYDFGPEPEHLSREGARTRIGRLGPVLVHAAQATRTRFTLVVQR